MEAFWAEQESLAFMGQQRTPVHQLDGSWALPDLLGADHDRRGLWMETRVARPYRALITQNHMVDLAGSEILTLELADALVRRDYEVTVFSHVVGDPISRVARERGISLTDDEDSLDDLRLDLAWIHHQVVPAPLESEISGIRATVVFGHMSPFEPLELPFLADMEARVGFAHVPVPFMAGRAADSIAAISRASEMVPFSVGGTYDRPIPRRIGEEAGLARADFGVEKAATAPLPTNGAALFMDALATIRQRYITVGL